MAGLGLYTMQGPNDEARATLRRMNPDAMLLLGKDALRWAAELPNAYTIYRSYELVPDSLTLRDTLDQCFGQGVEIGMALAYDVHGTGVKAVMSLNERHPGNQYDAERLGAFEGGVASVIVPRGLDFVAFNWSVGYRYPERVVWAWAELRRRCLAAGVDMRKIHLGYHGYTETAKDADAPWWENRVEGEYRAEFARQGVPFPEGGWGLSEAGFDNGVQNANGWRHNMAEADYAAYLKRLPGLTPQAKFRTIFAWRCTQDWADKGFEIEGAKLVEASVAETNKESPMPTDLAHEIWDEAFRWRDRLGAVGYNPNTAIGFYRETHTLFGMPLTGEFDGRPGASPWPVMVQVFAGGVILARKRDWLAAGATSERELRDVLNGPLG